MIEKIKIFFIPETSGMKPAFVRNKYTKKKLSNLRNLKLTHGMLTDEQKIQELYYHYDRSHLTFDTMLVQWLVMIASFILVIGVDAVVQHINTFLFFMPHTPFMAPYSRAKGVWLVSLLTYVIFLPLIELFLMAFAFGRLGYLHLMTDLPSETLYFKQLSTVLYEVNVTDVQSAQRLVRDFNSQANSVPSVWQKVKTFLVWFLPIFVGLLGALVKILPEKLLKKILENISEMFPKTWNTRAFTIGILVIFLLVVLVSLGRIFYPSKKQKAKIVSRSVRNFILRAHQPGSEFGFRSSPADWYFLERPHNIVEVLFKKRK